jgi:hypothetical protein
MDQRLTLDNFDSKVSDFLGEKELNLFNSEAGIKELFHRLGLLGNDSYPLRIIAKSISSFCKEHKGVEQALSDQYQFNGFLSSFVRLQSMENRPVNVDDFVGASDLDHDGLDKYLSKYSDEFTPGSSIFGFGIGDGFFEEHIVDLFGKKDVAFAGYDPYATKKNPNIRYMETADDFDGNVTWFVCRWVLHHVRPEQRWNLLGSFLAKLKPSTRILFIEEGTFKPFSDQNISEKAYSLLLCLSDVVFNTVVRGGWAKTADFFIQHLHVDDIQAIESSFKYEFDVEIHRFKNFNFHQTVLSYTLKS